jgi:surfactin synthase thioesterase subunit
LRTSGNEPLDLFCLPHAGGSARTYLRWQRSMPSWVRVRPVELAGRGRRIREPRPSTLAAAARDLVPRLDTGGRYAIFGHSMGGLLAYELARLLCRSRQRLPSFVVIAASRPPHLSSPNHYAELADLPDDELIDVLANDGSVPHSMRISPMRDQFLPVIRGDIELLAGYRPVPVTEPLPLDLLIWYGADDPTTPRCLVREWQRYTSRLCRLTAFPGGHFFIHDDLRPVAGGLFAAAGTNR